MCDKMPVYSFRWGNRVYFLCVKHGEQVMKLIELGVFFGELVPLDRSVSEILSCDEKVKE
jgi:hypothetical protein